MKKPIALILTAALMALPVSPVAAFADTTSETTAVTTTESPDTPVGEETDFTAADISTDSSESTEATEQDNTETDETTPVDSDGQEVDPGTLPDSPLYWLDELIEKIQVALTFNPEKKAKLIEKHACERLAEMLALAEKVNTEETSADTSEATASAENNTDDPNKTGDTVPVSEETPPADPVEQSTESQDTEQDNGEQSTEDQDTEDQNTEEQTTEDQGTEKEPAVTNPKLEKKIKACEKALSRYDQKIAHAQEFLAQLENQDSEEYQKLQEALAKVDANNVLVLGNLLEKLPPHAAQRLAVNIVRSMEKAIEKMEKMESKQGSTVDGEDQDTTTPDSSTTDTTTPDSKKPVVPVIKGQDKDTTCNSKNLTKKEYKELAKEAKKALKQFQKELGLRGADKAKTKDYDSKEWQKDSKKNQNDKAKSKDSLQKSTTPVKVQYNTTSGKKSESSYSNKNNNSNSNKNNNSSYQKYSKNWKDHDRDDDRGYGKGNRDRD